MTTPATIITIGGEPLDPRIVLDELTITWGMDAYGRSDDAPGGGTLTVLSSIAPHDPDNPKRWADAVLHVTRGTTTLFWGIVSAITATARGTGWRYKLTAIDAVGVLARLRVGDQPWPSEYPHERIQRLRAVAATLGFGALLAPIEPITRYRVAGRDVNAADLHEITARTIAPQGWALRCAGDYVTARPRADQVDHYSEPHPRITKALQHLEVPDRAIERPAYTLDSGGRLNRVEIRYRSALGDDTTAVLIRRDNRPTTTHSIDTDLVADATNPDLGSLGHWADRMLEAGILEWRPSPVRLILGRITHGDRILDATQRGGLVIVNPTLGRQRIVAGTLTITTRRTTCTVTICPDIISGVSPARIREWTPPPGQPPRTFDAFTPTGIRIIDYLTTTT